MADLATLQARLVTAESSYHNLVTGTREVEVQHDGMRVKYSDTTASMQALLAYINDLKAQIASLGGTIAGLRRRAIVVDL